MELSSRKTIAVLVAVSTAVLGYELTQIRVFSFSLHPVIAYSAIAIAMLGFGLGATWLAIRPAFGEADRARSLARLSVGLALSILIVNAFFSRTSTRTIIPGTLDVEPLWMSLVLIPCIAPYFLAGMITTIIFQVGRARIGRLYFWNLLGSAVGCIGMVLLLRPIGAEKLLLVAAAMSAAAGLIIAVGLPGATRYWAAASLLLALALLPFARAAFPFKPDVNGYNALFEAWSQRQGWPPPKREITEWDPIGRIDVLEYPQPYLAVTDKVRYRAVTIDGGAMTLMIEEPPYPKWGTALFGDSMYAAAYQLKKTPDVLVIGAGGGPDIEAAIYWEARSVVGVEISLSTIRAVTGPYRKFVGWPNRPEVTLVHADGRSFAKSTRRRFDVVQMSGVDTMTMHTSGGAMVAAEDYLYTVDAFADFLRILKPGGVLSVARFGDEAMNLSAIAVKALRQLGTKHPERCIAALRQAHMGGVLVKREPLGRDEVESLRLFAARRQENDIRIPVYDQAKVRLGALVELLYPPQLQKYKPPLAMKPRALRYEGFFASVAMGREDAALARMGNLFTPPTDDKPYYILQRFIRGAQRGQATHPAFALLLAATAIIGVASLCLILLPAALLRRRRDATAGTLLAVIAYFFAIGAGFMLLEVGTIHRATVFVSTPGAATAVVIGSILISSGLGALISDAIPWRSGRKILFAFVAMALCAVLYRLGIKALFDACFGLPVWLRCGIAAVTLAPIGFFMGWFFPAGLRAIENESKTLVPWAIAVNGFASVIGSLSTLFLGVLFGFTGVFVAALILYTIAVAVIALFMGGAPREA